MAALRSPNSLTFRVLFHLPENAGLVAEALVAMEIIFVTTNDEKWRLAVRILQKYPARLQRAEIDTPEIQAAAVEEVAGYSAKYAANQLGKPVIVTDGGYYISALNGFPGPFQKYMNDWLTPEDFINLMKPYADRRIVLKECLAFCEPDQNPILFTTEMNAEIAQKPAGVGSILDQVVIPEGYERPQGTYPIAVQREMWAEKLDHFHQFGKHIKQGNQE